MGRKKNKGQKDTADTENEVQSEEAGEEIAGVEDETESAGETLPEFSESEKESEPEPVAVPPESDKVVEVPNQEPAEVPGKYRKFQ